MYVRPHGDRAVKVPENYSGHAFRDSSPYGDMPPPAHIPTSPTLKRERVIVPPQAISQATSQPIYDTEQENTAEERFTIDDDETSKSERYYEETSKNSDEPKSSSIFASLLPTTTSHSSHFPFGHGIGSEELLILAVMLLVFLSEESDQELLLLLGFLLFAG